MRCAYINSAVFRTPRNSPQRHTQMRRDPSLPTSGSRWPACRVTDRGFLLTLESCCSGWYAQTDERHADKLMAKMHHLPK
mmetsp:Transcript_119541/g.217232  ORF Transcript_119541/g.217232 Transcript_119541/m.217232 type:complete len:80 (+) Transcript_119541:274-513(+)